MSKAVTEWLIPAYHLAWQLLAVLAAFIDKAFCVAERGQLGTTGIAGSGERQDAAKCVWIATDWATYFFAATTKLPSFLVTDVQHIVQKFRFDCHQTPGLAVKVSDFNIRGLPMRVQK